MARILALDEVPVALRNHLVRSLRSLDEAVLLPQAERHDDTGVYKNVVFRIFEAEPQYPGIHFRRAGSRASRRSRWRALSSSKILNDGQHRKRVLERLREAIPSEMAESSLQVGPALDGDGNDRDKDEWVAGFDGPGCFVELFAPTTRRRPCRASRAHGPRAPDLVLGLQGRRRRREGHLSAIDGSAQGPDALM